MYRKLSGQRVSLLFLVPAVDFSFSSTSLFLFLFPKEALVFLPMGIYRRFSLRAKKFWQQNNALAVFLFFPSSSFFKSPETVAHRGNRPASLFFLIRVQTQWKSFELAVQEKNQTANKIHSPSCKNNYIVVFPFFFFLVITSAIIKRTSWKIAREHELQQRIGALWCQKIVSLQPVANKATMKRQQKDIYYRYSTCAALTGGATIPAWWS